LSVLITGAAGLSGSYLIRYIASLSKNERIYGIDIADAINNGLSGYVKMYKASLLDEKEIFRIIKEVKPDKIFHLAGKFYGDDLFDLHIKGSINLFKAIIENNINPKIVVAGSSAEYGLVYENENPIKEDNPLRAVNDYGVSKIAQDFLSLRYFLEKKLDIVRARPFNNSAPGESLILVSSSFANQIAEIEKGRLKPLIHVGNLNSVRDISDTRDVVRAYFLLSAKGVSGEVYNICAGRGYRIKDILDILLSFTDADIKVAVDSLRFKMFDVPVQIGSFEKINSLTGWKPEIPIEKTLLDILNFWREKG